MVMQNVQYQSDAGDVHILRMSSARAAVAGSTAATGDSSSIRAKISKSNTEYGIRPRGVKLSRVVGTGDDASRKSSFLPVLTPTDFASAAFSIGGSITIGTIEWEIIAKVGEDF